jgi:hypothetical protein
MIHAVSSCYVSEVLKIQKQYLFLESFLMIDNNKAEENKEV